MCQIQIQRAVYLYITQDIWGGGRGGGVWGGPMPFPVLTLTPGLVPRLILTALSLGIGNETSVFNYDSLIYNGPFAF